MLGILKKKFRKAAGGVKKMENRDAVEATVWGAYSIAYSDGTCDAKEIAVLEKTIAALPAFAPFSGEIAQMSANIRAQYEASPRRANAQALRELADVSGTNDAVDVLCLCIDIADQDGIGAEEQEQLKKIARLFNCHWNSMSDGYKSTFNSGFGLSRAICAGGFHQHNPVSFIGRGVGGSSCNIGMADI